MASITNSAVQIAAGPCFARQTKVGNGFSGLKSAAFSIQKNFPSVRLQSGSSRLRVSCAAKAETLEKVCAIVKKQLALSDTTTVTGASSFTEDLGADSLDTVEVVMGLEEAFDISVEEDNAQSIKTVQDAADLIEKLIAARS